MRRGERPSLPLFGAVRTWRFLPAPDAFKNRTTRTPTNGLLDTVPGHRLLSLLHPLALDIAIVPLPCYHVVVRFRFSTSLLPSTRTRTARARATPSSGNAGLMVYRRTTFALRTFAQVAASRIEPVHLPPSDSPPRVPATLPPLSVLHAPVSLRPLLALPLHDVQPCTDFVAEQNTLPLHSCPSP